MLPHLSGTFRAVKAPRIGTFDDGTPWLNVRVVANRNKWNEETRAWETLASFFITIKVTGRNAERLQHIDQGVELYVSGEPETSEFTGRDGNVRSDTIIKPREVRIVESQRSTSAPASAGGSWAPAGGNESAYGDFGAGDDAPF